MDGREIALLIAKGIGLFLIIVFAVKIGVKEALVEFKKEEKKNSEQP